MARKGPEGEGDSMKILVAIGGVDGETEVTITTSHASSALNFLRTQDHEGSSVSLRLECEDVEPLYEVLRKVQNVQEAFGAQRREMEEGR